MSVLVVLVNIYLILRHLSAALRINGLTLGVLLRDKSLNLQLAELQRCLQSKKGLCSAYQTGIQVHRYVSSLDGLDNVILLTLILQFQILLIK